MKANIKSLFNRYYGALTFLILSGSILRLVNLGYSDYQGDEIKALYLPNAGQSAWDFLLSQRKGPLQFLITFLIKLIDPTYDNQFLVRLPFALAGIISIYFFYKLVKEHFGNRISLYATAFFITNGFLIAFSRIVQYQSLVIVFMLGALYYFTLASSKKEYQSKGILMGFILWALSLLSHYDGIFIAPFAFYLLYKWWKDNSLGLKKEIKIFVLIGSLVISGILLLSFYVPFLLSLSDKTMDYWEGRLTGEVSGKIASSLYLFSVYQPIYVVHFYKILAGLGIVLLLITFFYHKNKFRKIIDKLRIMTVSNKPALIALIAWIVPAVLFMEKLVYIPGTHIYVYLIPLFIFLSFGIYLGESILKRLLGKNIGRTVFIYGLLLLFSFIYAQSYVIFVDNSVEYPWRDEKFLLWTLPKPNAIFHLSMFGFPYYRNWEGIRDYLKYTTTEPTILAYSSNERKALVRYYVNLEKSADKAGIYIYINYPQSFTEHVLEEKPKYWTDKYPPEYTLSRNGEEIVRVYLMVPGSLEEIKLMGY